MEKIKFICEDLATINKEEFCSMKLKRFNLILGKDVKVIKGCIFENCNFDYNRLFSVNIKAVDCIFRNCIIDGIGEVENCTLDTCEIVGMIDTEITNCKIKKLYNATYCTFSKCHFDRIELSDDSEIFIGCTFESFSADSFVYNCSDKIYS